MMAVPPPNQSSSTPPSGREGAPSEGEKSKRDFNLPKKDRKTGDEEQKKKNLFDIAGAEAGVKELKQEVEADQKAEMQEASHIEAAETKASVSAISQLIQRLVTEMKIGQMDGSDFASLKLSTSEVPEAFAGSNLTLSYEENALVIHFDHFMTPQQENNAWTLVEKNKEQLLNMIQALQEKQIHVQELMIGNRTISLPRVESLPPPFQAAQAGSPETRQERERQGEEGEQGAGPE